MKETLIATLGRSEPSQASLARLRAGAPRTRRPGLAHSHPRYPLERSAAAESRHGHYPPAGLLVGIGKVPDGGRPGVR